MSTKIYIDWQDNDVLWNEEIREWENVYYIIYDLGGARDPKEWCEHPFDNYDNECKVNEIRDQLQRNLDRISEQYKQKLIEVMIQMGPDKFKDKRSLTNKKNVKITVEDIQTIAKEVIVKLEELLKNSLLTFSKSLIDCLKMYENFYQNSSFLGKFESRHEKN